MGPLFTYLSRPVLTISSRVQQQKSMYIIENKANLQDTIKVSGLIFVLTFWKREKASLQFLIHKFKKNMYYGLTLTCLF